jgi:integrase
LGKLPFTKGTALLRLTGKQEKEDAEVLPIEKLKGIYPQINFIETLRIINLMNTMLSRPMLVYDMSSRKDRKAIFDDYTLPFTLGILALNTGMRNSEVARIKREDFIGVGEKKTFLLRIWNKKTDYFNKTNESKYRKIPLHDFTTRAIKIYIKRKEELYGEVKGTDFLFGNAIIDKDSRDVDGFIHSRVFDKAVLLLLKLIKHKKDFREFFTDEKELIKTMGDIQSLQEELKEMKDAGKGISFYSFRKTFRTMLGLNNDLAEYYMGHKLGNDAKTTYIQVNSLKNETFVDEYAQPVISMLDKYIFLSDDEQDKLLEGYRVNVIDRNNFIKSRMGQGMSLEDAWGDYHREQKTMIENEETNLEKKGFYDRI